MNVVNLTTVFGYFFAAFNPHTFTDDGISADLGIFRNNGGIVTSRIGREEFFALQSEKFVEETFSGSLPAFLAAFTTRKNLSAEEIAQIRAMIDGFEEV